jgi:hypothetical protein
MILLELTNGRRVHAQAVGTVTIEIFFYNIEV